MNATTMDDTQARPIVNLFDSFSARWGCIKYYMAIRTPATDDRLRILDSSTLVFKLGGTQITFSMS
jgi:hypothetical protein